MKRKTARLMSIVLTLAMVIGMIPVGAVSAVEQQPSMLGGSGITVPEDTEGTFLAFAANTTVDGTPSAMWQLDETGLYTLTVFRAGDLSGETTVALRSIDSSAVYGKDYMIDDSGYETEITPVEGTLLQQYGDSEEAAAEGQEFVGELNGQLAASQEETSAPEEGQAEETGSPELSGPDEAAGSAEETESESVNETVTVDEAYAGTEQAESDPAAADDEKSELAKLKEEQTGQESRETADTEYLPLEEDLVSSLIPDLGSAVETSSSTLLTFRPGETEKNVSFRILEDTEAEGSEVFSFTLSEAEGAAVFTPSVLSVTILDDEPVEHSQISFSDAEYRAQDGKVTVTVTRSGAEYSLVTARVCSAAGDSAAGGSNYDQVNEQVEFSPYSTEETLEIPVTASPGKEISFELGLSDFRGGVEGAIVKAAVTVPAGPETEVSGSAEEESDGELMGADSSIKIPGFGVEDYTLEPLGNDHYKIMDNSKKPAQQIGLYVVPTHANATQHDFGDGGDRWTTWKPNGSDGYTTPLRRLEYYSKLAWNQGGVEVKYTLRNYFNYQQVYLDFATMSSYSSCKSGCSYYMRGPNTQGLGWKEWNVGADHDRQIYGSGLLYLDYLSKSGDQKIGYMENKLVPNFRETNPNYQDKVFNAYTKRTAFGCTKPSMCLFGYVFLYRQYQVTVEQPDHLKYIDSDVNGNAVVVSKAPANCYLAEGHNVRYPYQQISIIDKAVEAGGNINGTLKGYYIRPSGTDGKGYYLSTDKNVIDLNDDLMAKLDTYAREHRMDAVIKKGSGNNYYMDLFIKPVYERKNITVKIGQSGDGKFKWSILNPADSSALKSMAEKLELNASSVSADTNNGTITGLFAVGDRLNLDAKPNEDDFSYTSCHYEGYKNPGDTSPEINMELNQQDQMTDWKMLTLSRSKTELRPNFTSTGNCIEVRYENGADQYFYFSGLASKSEGNGKFADKNVLYIDDSFSGDHVTPVLGKAYTLKATENPWKNNGTIRPVFRLSDGTVVKGWTVDVIAKYKASQNVITVGWESYDPSQIKWYSLEGLVRYDSVTIRQSSQELENEPAKYVSVTAAGHPVEGYSKNGASGKIITRPAAETDTEGKFSVDGIRALSGDTISILVNDNGVTEVEYRTLPEKRTVEERTFVVQQANSESRSNELVKVTEECVVVDLSADCGDGQTGPVDMPIITGYTPYVTDVRFSLEDNVADTRDNMVPIYAGDYITAEADVSVPKLGDRDAEISEVRFVLYDKNNELKDTWIAEQEKLDDDDKMNTWSVRVPYTPPENSPYQEITDGDRIYVQIIGPDTEMTKTHVDDDGNITSEVTTVKTPYALLNTGLSFYTPVVDGVSQSYELTQKNLGTADLLGKLQSKGSSGKLTFEKQYADPDNKETSSYTLYAGVDLAANSYDIKKTRNLDKIKSLMQGGDSGSDAKQKFDEKWESDQYDNPWISSRDEAYERIDNDPGMTDEEKQTAKDKFDSGQKGSYLQDQKKKSLNAFGEEKQRISGELKVMMAWEWVYDPDSNSHNLWGFGIYLAGIGGADRTFYTVYVIPFYLNLEGRLSIGYEGGKALEAQKVYAKEFAKQNDLREYDSSDYGWMTFGVDGKITVGAGINGVIGARGFVKFSFLGTFATTSGWEPDGGVSFALGGGIGFDLLYTSLDWSYTADPWTTGYYSTKPVKKVKVDDDASLQNDSGEKITAESGETLSLKAFDRGEETYNAIEEESADLQSVLKPEREETIIDGAMEYVRPQTVALDNDTFLFLFLENREGEKTDSGSVRSEKNSSALVYAVADVTEDNRLEWDHDTGTVIVDNDGLADTTPDVLRIGDDIYVAWSAGDASDVETVEGAKDALKSTNLKLQKFEVSRSGDEADGIEKSGEVIEVTADDFQNCYPQLVEENGNLALYYFKNDLKNVTEADDLADMTGNYNTWARRLYDTDLNPLPQTGNNGSVIDENTEMYVALPGDVMTTDLTVKAYVSEDGKEYRMTAYTIDGDNDVQTGEDRQLWLQVENLSDGRAYYPLRIAEGSLANMQMNTVQIKNRNAEGRDVVQDDIFLTWVSDETAFNTFSFNALFEGLKAEGDGSSLQAVRSLTEDEIAGPEWIRTAYEKAGADPEVQITLHDLAEGEPVYEQREFGVLTAPDGEEAETQGYSVSDYILISGDDGNTYLAWTLGSSYTGNMGSELWMSSYFTINSEVKERFNENETGDNSAGLPAAGWSTPVQVTDFRLTMTDEDRSLYDSLLGKDLTDDEEKTLYELGAKYSRAIDELAAVVSQDSGAVMLANTYLRGYSEEEGYKEEQYKLSAIRCVPDTSLEVSEISLSKEAPLPGETVQVTAALKNTGLLPATDYEITAKDSGGTFFEKDVSDAAYTIYVDGEDTVCFDWKVPSFLNKSTLTVSVREKNPTTGRTDYSTVNSNSIEVTRKPVLYTGIPYGLLARDYVQEASLKGMDVSSNYVTEENDLLASKEYLALLDYYGSADQVVEAYEKTNDEDTTQLVRYFYVFVPVRNEGNEALKNLNFKITNQKDERELGTADLEKLDAGESGLIPVLMIARKSDFDGLGVVSVNVDITDQDGKELESIPINVQLLENMGLTIGAEGENADQLQVLDMTTDQQLMEVLIGKEAAEKADWDKMEAEDPMNRAKRVDLKVGESIQLNTEAFPHNSLKKVDFSDMTHELQLMGVQPNPNDIVSVTSDGMITAMTPGTAMVVASDRSSEGEPMDVVLVYVSSEDASGCPKDGSCPMSKFTDTDQSAWYHDGVHWALAEGIMNGTGTDTFEPLTPITRAMIVTMLWRMEGSPQSEKNFTFADVPEGKWYTDAVRWAAENGIVNGYSDEEFGPGDQGTREQIVTILYRYAKWKNLDVSSGETASLDAYTDAASISEWAEKAFRWAVSAGMINGVGGGLLDPKGEALRAQVATMLMRYSRL